MLAAAYSPSFAQAAKKCFTSRQNVAHSIKALENELGVTLFKRSGNEMLLTSEGVQVARRANEIIEKVDSIRVMFVDPDARVLPMSVAVSTNLFAGVPSGVNTLFTDSPGETRISELDCEDCYRSVCSKKADMALIMCMEREFPECSAFNIASSLSYGLVCASSHLAKLTHLTVAYLKDQRLFLMSEPVFQYEPLLAQLDSLGYDRSFISVIPSTSSMNHLVRRSLGVSLVSEKFAAHPPEGTVAIPLFDPRLNWHFYMLHKMHASNYGSLMKLSQDIRGLFETDGGCGTISSQSF